MIKTKAKFIIALAIMLLVVSLFNGYAVRATDTTDETLQEVANLLPNKISLSVKEVEFENATNNIAEEIEKSLKNNNIEYKKTSTEWEGIQITLQGKYEGIEFSLNTPYFYSKENIKQYEIFIQSRQSGKFYNKKIEVEYNNSNKYNTSDEQAVKKLNIKPAGYYEVAFDKNEDVFKVAEKYYTNLVNDKTITIKVWAGAGEQNTPLNDITCESGTYIGIFKNDVLYDVRQVGNDISVPAITIPSNITDDKINDYILNLIRPKYIEFLEILGEEYNEQKTFDESKIKISKGAVFNFRESVSHNGDGTLNEKYTDVTIKDGYTITYGNLEPAYLIVRKETNTKPVSKTDKTTNIKLDATTDIVPADTKLIVNKVTEGKSYIGVEQALGSNVSKFELYDISLVSNNATIQPNGKVKISIPVPNGYDTSKLVVYRIAEDGTKTKYETTISNGYITFETDHFSNYVVAEESTTTSTETPTETDNTTTPTTSTNNKQLDNTPKTGAESYTTIISTIVSTICALGLAVIKRI